MGAEFLSSRAVRALLQQSMVSATPDPWVEMVSTLFQSDQDSETYKWLSETPALREWKGQRQVNDFVDYGITVINTPYEATIEVKKREMRRDKTGQLEIKVGDLARRAQTHWAKLICEMLESNPTAYDGQSFFSASHSELDSGTQTNLGTSNITTANDPTAADMKDAILDAVSSIVGFKDSAGEPVNEDASQFMVLVPTNMLSATAAAVGSSVIVESGGAVTNTMAVMGNFGFRYAATARFTSDDVFYVFRTDGMVPAVIRQQESLPLITAKAEGSDYEHDYNAHQYGVSIDRAVAPGRWQNAVQHTFT